MSDLPPPDPRPNHPPRRDWRIAWTALVSLLLHAGLLAFLFLPPLPRSVEAAPPPAIDVTLVPAEEISEPPQEEDAPLPEDATSEEPTEDAESTTEQSTEAASPESLPSEPPLPGNVPEAGPSGVASASAPSAPEPPASTRPEPAPGTEASAEVAPIPLPRPAVRALSAPSSAAGDGASARTGSTDEAGDATGQGVTAAIPDAATLELGPIRNAARFYLEAMLSTPGMARAREMLQTLPAERRVSQTCNIEALAQVGNAGEGFAPDVVMADAYARSELSGTRIVAPGAIFRSGDRWYGLAFDCTLSDDLTRIAEFSYRLGADVTDAVLARLEANQSE